MYSDTAVAEKPVQHHSANIFPSFPDVPLDLTSSFHQNPETRSGSTFWSTAGNMVEQYGRLLTTGAALYAARPPGSKVSTLKTRKEMRLKFYCMIYIF